MHPASENFTVAGKEHFLRDEMVQDAVLRNLQIMAESTKRLSENTRASAPAVDWTAIAGFRNVLVHDYLGVDLEEVWRIIESFLPDLDSRISALLKRYQT
jgi:uncharacterized protein with HEPN domain